MLAGIALVYVLLLACILATCAVSAMRTGTKKDPQARRPQGW